MNETETNWIRRNISEKVIHPDYNPENRFRKSDADIAILIMKSPVEFTDFIQPICLPSSTQNVENIQGTVAGYGKSGLDDRPTEIPYKINLKTLELVECFDSDPYSTKVLSARSFCANHATAVLCQGNSKIYKPYV